MSNKSFAVIIMIWFTIIAIWAVNNVTTSLNNNTVSVQGIPDQFIPEPISSIQMDEDTVWIINANSNFIKVITHDKDGYHITESEMSFQEQ
jgi:hypothetical protein